MPEKSETKQTITELSDRYQDLNTKKIQAATNLENAQRELEKWQGQAREQYSTDDIAELKEKLAAMEAENERKLTEYQTQLDKIERDLKETESKYAETKESTQEA